MKIAFFDFDGTITKDDSTAKFIRYFFGDIAFIKGIIIDGFVIFCFSQKLLTGTKIQFIDLNASKK